MLEKIISNPVYALGCFTFLIFLGWSIFVKLFPLNSVQWKKVDYWWLSLSAIGLVGLLAENRMAFGKRDLYQCDSRIYIFSRAIQSDLNSQWICMKFQKTEYNLDYFDKTQKEFEIVCQWANDVFPTIDSLLNSKISIKSNQLAIPKDIDDNQLKDYLVSIHNNVEEYNSYISNRQIIEDNTHSKEWEDFIRILAPLTLIIGLAIRFTKTIGEINLQKKLKD
jgi:hypothetical protein